MEQGSNFALNEDSYAPMHIHVHVYVLMYNER